LALKLSLKPDGATTTVQVIYSSLVFDVLCIVFLS
jgi:hypothetical protein